MFHRKHFYSAYNHKSEQRNTQCLTDFCLSALNAFYYPAKISRNQCDILSHATNCPTGMANQKYQVRQFVTFSEANQTDTIKIVLWFVDRKRSVLQLLSANPANHDILKKAIKINMLLIKRIL